MDGNNQGEEERGEGRGGHSVCQVSGEEGQFADL